MKKPKIPTKPKAPREYTIRGGKFISLYKYDIFSLKDLIEVCLEKAADFLEVPIEEVLPEQIGIFQNGNICETEFCIMMPEDHEEYNKLLEKYNRDFEKYKNKLKEYKIKNDVYKAYILKSREEEILNKINSLEKDYKKFCDNKKIELETQKNKLRKALEATKAKKENFIDNVGKI